MKKWFLVILTGAALLAATAACFAQGNRGSAKLTLSGTSVSVDFGRPSLKGRTFDDMLKLLADPSQNQTAPFWRLGANKSTTFSTSGALVFGEVTIPAGEYSLWARQESDAKWKLFFNKQHGQWGTQHDPAQDIAPVSLKEEKAEKPVDQLSIKLEEEAGGGELSVEWGDRELSTTFKVK
jgi:hypothetical protein